MTQTINKWPAIGFGRGEGAQGEGADGVVKLIANRLNTKLNDLRIINICLRW